ncbi:hypothetical protein ACQP1K_25440 [Sphaerimonospora sp. CA-214678]|uniref:hypothetical protein n=1 Tax=Sphaerimonospora sp. CA-214678 TaxID=3240029 RepID=UPI003D94E082
MTTTSVPLTELLAVGAPELWDVELAPDNRYQTRTVTVREVTDAVVATLRAGFDGLAPDDFPRLIVGWGRCRVGSTAITNLFGMAGISSYYQPVKTIARFVLSGGEGAPWRLPDGEPVLFAKEMAGPYVPYECVFNPVQCLIDAGWPAGRLHLLVLDRDPAACLDSWMAKWAPKIGRDRVVANFRLSTANYLAMRAFAEQAGVTTTHFPYEASRRPEIVVPRLFAGLGVADRFSPAILTAWGAAGDLNSDSARIHYPAEPEAYVVPGLHGNEQEYRFREREIRELTPQERAVADDPGVRDRYRESIDLCRADLDLDDVLGSVLFG